MGVNLEKHRHVIFFVVVLPAASILVAWLINALVQSVVDARWLFLYDTIGVLGAYAALYRLFNDRAWRWPIFQKVGVVDVPDLNGRWLGSVKSSHNEGGTEVRAALEIRQTFAKVSVSLYFPQSRSSSIIAGFSSEPDGPVALHYEYQNMPHADAADSMHMHRGTATLRFIMASGALEGSYYNWGRDDRGHVGTMNFSREGSGLKESI
jgi:predicted pore-forming effector associated with SMODS systems